VGQRIGVIGAGIIGCLIAKELLSAYPDADIVVLDRDLAGSGASRRSAGVHFPTGRTASVRSMASFSQSYYEDLRRVQPDLPIFPIDLYAISSAQAAQSVRANFIAPGELCGPDAAGPIAADVAAESVSWNVPGCQVADVAGLVAALARELRERVQLLEGAAVTAVTERNGHVEVSLANGQTLAFAKLVLAPGPWVGDEAWRHLTGSLGIRIKKVVAFHLDLAVENTDCALLFPEEDAFLVPLAYRGHWLFSYTCTEWDVVPEQLHWGVSATDLRDAREVLMRYARELEPALRFGRVFCDAYSTDRQPVVTSVGASGNVVFAGAANGSGYRLAPAIARAAAHLLA
jgi:glycine/D-amino acid oxidase-like deaminating enzyme